MWNEKKMLIEKEIIKFGTCTQILDYEFIQSFKFYEWEKFINILQCSRMPGHVIIHENVWSRYNAWETRF